MRTIYLRCLGFVVLALGAARVKLERLETYLREHGAAWLAVVLLLCVLAGCQHPNGKKEAAATTAAITRTSDQIHAADEANARAQAHTAAAQSAAARIAELAAGLEAARW